MRKHIGQVSINGNPNPGIFCSANDNFVLIPNLEKNEKNTIQKILNVKAKKIEIASTNLVGILSAMNNNGIVLPYIIEKEELKKIKNLGLNVFISPLKETAIGNLILCNDKGALISKHLKSLKNDIEKCLEVPVEVGTIAGLDIVGSCGIVTNEGAVIHIDATKKEINVIEKLFGMEVGIGTVNTGSPYIKSGLVGNSSGFIISKQTTGPELQRIDESLGFI